MSSVPLNEAVSISSKQLILLRHVSDQIVFKVGKVKSRQSGNYLSAYKGRGMEFDEVRSYQAGDDIKTMDWKVTARTGKPHTKLFREERERTIFLWVDLRKNMFFATRGAFKSVIASRLATILAWASASHGDRLGGLIFSDLEHHEIKPTRGKKSVLHFIHQLVHHPVWQSSELNEVGHQGLSQSLARLRRVAKPGSLIFLLSDFQGLDQQAHTHINQLSRHNDLTMVSIHDPIEATLPPPGFYRVSDGQAEFNIQTHSKQLRKSYHQRFINHMDQLKKICLQNHIHLMNFSTEDDIVSKLQQELMVIK
ncbi:MAG: DUF58 domain-containing protein [Methylococcales bacterium]|jgi:uncharacterized protein (DUF58 family)|nr:DUF58 domain-containing protein [Methylococcales bacterium]